MLTDEHLLRAAGRAGVAVITSKEMQETHGLGRVTLAELRALVVALRELAKEQRKTARQD